MVTESVAIPRFYTWKVQQVFNFEDELIPQLVIDIRFKDMWDSRNAWLRLLAPDKEYNMIIPIFLILLLLSLYLNLMDYANAVSWFQALKSLGRPEEEVQRTSMFDRISHKSGLKTAKEVN